MRSGRLMNVLWCVLVATVMLPSAVFAQVFRPGGDFLEPGFTTKDLEHAAQLFGFDEVQREIAGEMVNEYLGRMGVGVRPRTSFRRPGISRSGTLFASGPRRSSSGRT